jgi:hypothetical protein
MPTLPGIDPYICATGNEWETRERERERNKALKCPLLSTSRVVATPLLQARTI